ncbi:GbsR/MarR family transcriptional regulator [bacterium LRH843]|nr:GbsR/MarR family transcriptional regulator [bacterium LRH843]
MFENHQEEWNKLELAREQFIQHIAQNMYLYGISPSIGRLYGTVLFADKPMNLDEMSQSLGMSKTSMSTGIRALLEANMVERVWQKGNRKDLYKPEEDWYKSFSSVFINRWRSTVDNNLEALREMRQLLLELKSSENEFVLQAVETDLDKLNTAENYYNWLKKVIVLFESEEIYNIVPKE